MRNDKTIAENEPSNSLFFFFYRKPLLIDGIPVNSQTTLQNAIASVTTPAPAARQLLFVYSISMCSSSAQLNTHDTYFN